MEKTYAQALFQLSRKEGADTKALVEELVKHLTETGRMKLLPRILRELKRIEARATTLGDSLEVASEAEKKSAETEAKSYDIHARAAINPSLVSGWRARSGSRLIDRSGKRALLDLYKQIIANA